MCAKQPREGRDASLIALAMFAALSLSTISGPGHALSPTQPTSLDTFWPCIHHCVTPQVASLAIQQTFFQVSVSQWAVRLRREAPPSPLLQASVVKLKKRTPASCFFTAALTSLYWGANIVALTDALGV